MKKDMAADKDDRKCFVLVHGAMHGGWCWKRVKPLLSGAGYDVYTPTLTGMGERAHLMDFATGLGVHVRDIENVLEYEDISGVILVGHSYGGMVVTAAAESCRRRIERIVYLDAYVPDNGQSLFDVQPEATVRLFKKWADAWGDGRRVVPSRSFPENWGILDEDLKAWVFHRLTDYPLVCSGEKVSLSSPEAAAIKRTYIRCTGLSPAGRIVAEDFRSSVEKARQEGWDFYEIEAGHDAMLTHPEAVAKLLIKTAGGFIRPGLRLEKPPPGS
jgi:pimeloyl-ACP methyl ester carboxylesterase